MSHYALRRAAMLGTLGAAAPTFAKAQTDLTNQVAAVISAGDQYLAAVATSFDSGYYNDAVNAYQAAGNAAVIGVGPEIDGSGAPGVTQPLTQQAWQLNGQLAAVHALPAGTDHSKTGGPTATDATKAQGLAKQISALLQTAITNGQAALQNAQTTPLPAAPGETLGDLLSDAGTALVNRLTNGGCPQVPFAECTNFQRAWNNAGVQPTLTVDGKYDSSTQAALQRMYDATGGGSAPTNCYGQAVTPVPQPTSIPALTSPAASSSTSTSTTSTPSAASTGTNWTQVATVTALGVGAGAVAWLLYTRSPAARLRYA